MRRARTIRLRLTLIYGGVFLVSSAALLTVGYLLVRRNLGHRHTFRSEAVGLAQTVYHSLFGRPLRPFAPDIRAFQAGYHQAIDATLHRLLLEYAGALVVMTGVSVALGWWMAGRALAPLRAITSTAQRVSGENLGERIALQGPDDELKELADTFDGMLRRLDAAFASQKRFVANASHELRTPLAIMRTEVDVALADPHASVEELRAMGEAVRETIDRSEALIASLLLLARSGGLHGREEPVNLAQLAGDAVTDLTRGAEAVGVRITTALEPAMTRGDADLLARMLANLVENGIRHNRPGGELRIASSTVAGMVEVLVRNDGAPINPQHLSSLTEPFRRLSRKTGGFGLGLSIVRSVAEVHGGTLTLTAPPQGGLEVRVQLPAASVEGPAAVRPASLATS
jgi:signal transduction histidine kinase